MISENAYAAHAKIINITYYTIMIKRRKIMELICEYCGKPVKPVKEQKHETNHPNMHLECVQESYEEGLIGMYVML